MPPQKIHWFDGGRLQPHVFAVEGARDPRTFKRVYTEDKDRKYPGAPVRARLPLQAAVDLSYRHPPARRARCRGADPVPARRRRPGPRPLFAGGVRHPGVDVDRDWVGVTLSLFLGILLGGISGFYGGVVDSVIQRAIEIIRSIPAIPFWMGLAAFLPRDWSVLQIYFAITHHHLGARLDRPGAGGAGTVPGVARRGFRDRRATLRREPHQDYLPLHAAVVLQPHHRRDHPVHSADDHQRDGAQLSRARHPAAGGQLRDAAAGGAERADRGAHTMADASGGPGHHRRARLQLPRRRRARRRRSLLTACLRPAARAGSADDGSARAPALRDRRRRRPRSSPPACVRSCRSCRCATCTRTSRSTRAPWWRWTAPASTCRPARPSASSARAAAARA